MKLPIITIVASLALSLGAFGHQTGEAPRSLNRIGDEEEFSSLSRVIYNERFGPLPHLMFVIDRADNRQIYYVNSNLFRFHRDFVNASYLSLDRGVEFHESNYRAEARRFILGTIAFQSDLKVHTFEFWEGDRLTPSLLIEAYRTLGGTFFARLLFRPNSTQHEDTAREVNSMGERPEIPVLDLRETGTLREYQPLTHGTAIGQLNIVNELTADVVVDRNQIVIFRETPLSLTPISGLITTSPASPLSHVNLLAKSWGIPAAYIKNADRLFADLEGKYVRLSVEADSYRIEPADLKEIEARNREMMIRAETVTPPADPDFNLLTDLADQRKGDAIKFGAKSANLGELVNAGIPSIQIPRGFTVPFFFYNQFLAANNLEEAIADAIEDDRFVHDPRYRRERLGEIRSWIQDGRHDEAFRRLVLARVRREYPGKGLFVRSSTNAEDLPDFSGAGLYTTVPNVRTEEQLLEAIKTVWASIWNYEAYEARESFGMNHFGVHPGVLIQEGIDADSAGVAITTDPFDRSNRDAVYINAKRGLGIRVVEGSRVAEQVIYSPRTGIIRVLTRSQDDTMLSFDDRGGVREIEIESERAVLTDDMIRLLSDACLKIKDVFGGADQDIEWLFREGRLYVVQSRPYVESR